jgi:hypothetical protein
MTKKVYTTAQGKSVDLGAIILQNEHVRAVGNMNVNARGDLLDGSSRVIDQRNQQVTRQMERNTQPAPTGVSTQPRHTSSVAARRAREAATTPAPAPAVVDPVVEAPIPDPVAEQPVPETPAPALRVDRTVVTDQSGGLAGAMARSRTVAQEKLKTQKEIVKTKPGVTKL